MSLRQRRYLNESMGANLVDDYFRGKLSLGQLIKKAGGLDKVATKADLEMFARNGFMLGMKSDELGVKKAQLVSKTKALLKKF